MKIKFGSESLVSTGNRRQIIIEMIEKGERERDVDGVRYRLRYNPNANKVYICATEDFDRNGAPKGWMINYAIIERRSKNNG